MSFFSGLTGGKQRDDMAAGHTAYRDALGAGTAAAKGHQRQGYNNALSRFQPYSQMGEQGRGDYGLYRNSIGLGGQDGYDQAFETFEADPFKDYRNQNVGNVLRDSFRRYNSGGMANSGANMLAQGRIGAEYAQRDVDDFRNRLQGAGQYGAQMGYGADAAMAGLDQSHYNALASDQLNLSNAEAQSHIGLAGHDAQTRGLGMNNMMRLGGMALDAASMAMGMPPGAGSKMSQKAPHSGAYNPWSSTATRNG